MRKVRIRERQTERGREVNTNERKSVTEKIRKIRN
jgi:hypothetical protein